MARIVDVSEVLLELGLQDSTTDYERALVLHCITKAEGAVRRYLKYDPVLATRTEYYPIMNFSGSGSGRQIWEATSSSAYVRELAEAATSELQLQHIPIRSSTAPQVFVDYDGRSGEQNGSFADATELTLGTDFWPSYELIDSDSNKVCKSGILRSEGRWPGTPGSVKVIYTAGYTQTELRGQDSVLDASGIWEAVLAESIRRVKKATSRGKSNQLGLAAGAIKMERMGDYEYETHGPMFERLIGTMSELMGETVEALSEFMNYGFHFAA